ncbi:hypothetical protein HK104_006144, partial [Borealophlyctis nickersoniae]
MQPPTSKRVKRRSSPSRLNLLPWPPQTPKPIVPYEIIRLIAQRSPLATAARVRRLDRTTARVILTADLVLIKAVDLCEDGLEYALGNLGDAIEFGSVQGRPDISEAVYTTLVEWGADPEDEAYLVMSAICFSHFNVVRAMVAAKVDVLWLFDQYLDYQEGVFPRELRNPEFLVEELGYEPTPRLLRHAVSTGQWENAAYLVSRGADPSTIEAIDIYDAIALDSLETLEGLLQNREHLHASEMLKLWEVATMGLAIVDSSYGVDYQLLKSIATEDDESLPPGDPNAFNGAPLCLAASRYKIETIKLLLERGAVVTELILRVAVNNPENIEAFLLLLPVAQNYDPSSLLRLAQASGNTAAERVLRKE